MGYFNLVYQIYKNGTTKKSVYDANSHEACVKSFHQSMTSVMGDADVTHALVMAMDTNGLCIRSETYDAEEMS